MKIIKLSAENLLRLHAVEIDPKGNVVRITGKNTAGKTSVLTAIWMALGGGGAIPDRPVRDGAETGFVRLQLGENGPEVIVERKFGADGTTSLVVTNAEGARFPSPQKMLDQLVGTLTFNPLEFMRMKPRDQGQTLRELVKLDTTALDRDRERAFEQRTIVNRRVSELEAQGRAITVPPNAPDREEDAAVLVRELTEAIDHNASNVAKRRIEENSAKAVKAAEQRVADVTAMLKEADTALLDIQQVHQQNRIAAFQLADRDTAPIQARIDTLKARNEAARARAKKRELAGQYGTAKAEADALTAKITKIDESKAAQLTSASYPVPGLGFSDDGAVTYNALPLTQASGAEQLKVSMAMAMSLNPKLRVLRITDGSLLDSDSMAVIEQMARDHDFQVWLEQVDETGKVGVVISDGMVQSDNQP